MNNFRTSRILASPSTAPPVTLAPQTTVTSNAPTSAAPKSSSSVAPKATIAPKAPSTTTTVAPKAPSTTNVALKAPATTSSASSSSSMVVILIMFVVAIAAILAVFYMTNRYFTKSGSTVSTTSNLAISGNETVGGTLNVTGTTALSNVTASGTAAITGQMDVSTYTGIGTASSSDNMLTVQRSDVSSGYVARLNGTNTANNGLITNIANNTNNRAIATFQAGGTTRAIIDGAGKLGIGDYDLITRTPVDLLEVDSGTLVEGVSTASFKKVGGLATATFFVATGDAGNAAACALSIRANSATSRSVNLGGTLNISGADYSEYLMKRSDCGPILKGAVCGVDADGLLTDKFSLAKHFMIKSTSPGIVGNDIWGQVEELDRTLFDSDEDYNAAKAAQMEEERQKFDRIAFCGQVPVNLKTTSARPGDYIVPMLGAGDTIEARSICPPLTLQQTTQYIGKVLKVVDGVVTCVVRSC
jgi:hypothetical protein